MVAIFLLDLSSLNDPELYLIAFAIQSFVVEIHLKSSLARKTLVLLIMKSFAIDF